ncbi:MAG: type IV toxin-antitoxin system AbiEi family antitoxin domain-containing protein, partial [Anaerolineales bacterium]|nr:type IV toxin-antitoxin system AbiEi family antitoxin domain-containing protein [Anaerolineales bacterium]
TRDALRLGITPRTLYALRAAGVITEMSRGLYRLADLPPLEYPDLVTAALKIPQGVICLISALAFHDLTTQIPHAVHVAVPAGAERPRLSYPPVRVFWFSGLAFSRGIETHTLDRVAVKVYSPEKTVADCFKLRHRLGLDIALEALRRQRQARPGQIDQLLYYARLNRVERVMRPYLEALA